MLELLNINIRFLLRTTHRNEDGQNPIVLRITFRGERREVFTGLYCFKKNWGKENSKVGRGEDNAATVNQNLELIHRKASHAFDELKFAGNPFTIDELMDKIKGKEIKPTLLIDFLEEGNQKVKRRVGTEILHSTYMK